MSLQISIRECGDIKILDLDGSSIMGGESESLSRYLRTLLADGARKLLLNLSNLSKVDSSGVSVIVETYISLQRQGGLLKLLSPCGQVLEVLTIYRLLDAIPNFEDETQALASFRSRVCSATA